METLLARRPAGPSALAREAAMARQLAALMEDYASVLWVGGLAHWCRIEARLRSADFSAPDVPTAPPFRWRRGRLAPSALHHMTGQTPWKIQRFAASPPTFDPVALVLRMLHEAGPAGRLDVGSLPEPCTAIDRARVGVYARNLAATDGLREEPQLSELVGAARNVVGPRYAARVYHLGMTEQTTATSTALDPPTFDVHPKRETAGYRFRTRWITVEPWRAADHVVLPIPENVEVERLLLDRINVSLKPGRAGEEFSWGAYPPEQTEYRGVRRLRPAAGQPLRSGRNAARAILEWSGRRHRRPRHDSTLARQRLYFREEQRRGLNIRNGVIDWTSDDEQAAVLHRRPSGGWSDPDSPHVGSVSREFTHTVLESFGEAQVTLRTREWTAITLDHPTTVPDQDLFSDTFYQTVISELVDIQGERYADNLYGWLGIVFKFAAGKPFVYYSRYVRSPRVFRLAREHGLQLVHYPLHRIPASLIARHGT